MTPACRQARLEGRAGLLEAPVHLGIAKPPQDDESGGGRQRVPGERARLVHRPGRRELVHDVRAPAEGREREASTGDLPEHGEVRLDPVELLRPAARDAEAGDHLVEDEEGAGSVAQGPERFEEPRRGRDDAHVPRDRLDDHRRETLAVALDRGGSGVDVVVGGDDRVAGRAARHAWAGRQPEGGEAGAGLGEQRVGVAVVAARELEDAVAVGRAAREPDRAHRGLRAGRDQPHLLHRRHRVHDLLGEVHLPLGRRAEGRPVCGRLLHGLDDLGVGVAEDERPPRHDPVDVAAALGVLDVGAFAAPREERLAGRDGIPRTHRRVDAARNERPGAPEETGPYSQPASSFAQ